MTGACIVLCFYFLFFDEYGDHALFNYDAKGFMMENVKTKVDTEGAKPWV